MAKNDSLESLLLWLRMANPCDRAVKRSEERQGEPLREVVVVEGKVVDSSRYSAWSAARARLEAVYKEFMSDFASARKWTAFYEMHLVDRMVQKNVADIASCLRISERTLWRWCAEVRARLEFEFQCMGLLRIDE
jgi:hypothetical protein